MALPFGKNFGWISVLGAWICCAGETVGGPPVSANGDWWATRPLVRPAIPASAPAAASVNPLDVFVEATLRRDGKTMSAAADRSALFRRLTIDLHGLVPASTDIAAFVADERPDALEREVDRLLASPRYGERWARHWLDVVHFAESHGHDQDRPRDHAWPYRDYLIESFNADKPYGRFVQEQVAADALFPGEQHLLPALGFLSAGPWDESSLRDIREDTVDREIGRYLDRDDIVANVMSSFVSVTAHCARCHDHKFDPISQTDYYALQAVFAGVEKAERWWDMDASVHERREHLVRFGLAVEHGEWDWVSERLTSDLRVELAGAHLNVAESGIEMSPEMERRVDQEYLSAWVAREVAVLPKPQRVFVATSLFPPNANQRASLRMRRVQVLGRGEIHRPTGDAGPGALGCIGELNARFELDGAASERDRRAALAKWLSHPENPLVWRSIVNRVWLYHFGRGLVAEPNDFGKMGGEPRDIALLDWLAVTFREDLGGSIKGLHRLILTSRTWSQCAADSMDGDPLRPMRRRMDAETFRDSVLKVSGQLDETMGGPSVRPFVMTPGIHVTPNVDYLAMDVDDPSNKRRSIYRFLFRTLPDPLMALLDSPAGDQSVAVRGESFTPMQALALMNHPFVIRHAGHLATHLQLEACDLSAGVDRVVDHILYRAPSFDERLEWEEHVRHHGWQHFCRLLLNANEFHFVE